MGYVLELLPKQIITNNGNDFLNAVEVVARGNNGYLGSTTQPTTQPSTLYQKAQARYDEALKNLTETQNLILSLETELTTIEAKYQLIEGDMKSGSSERITNAINEILTRGRYREGNPEKSYVGDWGYLYDGASGMEHIRAMQRKLVLMWIDEEKKKAATIKKELEAKKAKVPELQKEVDRAKEELDRAIKSEEKAAQIKIAQEQAKNAPELARLAAENARISAQNELKKRKQKNILIISVSGIAVAGLVFYLVYSNKKKVK